MAFSRSAYAASKFAQLGFFESLRLEEEKNNIDISMVFPGFVNTDISKNALSGTGVQHGVKDQTNKMELALKNVHRILLTE